MAGKPRNAKSSISILSLLVQLGFSPARVSAFIYHISLPNIHLGGSSKQNHKQLYLDLNNSQDDILGRGNFTGRNMEKFKMADGFERF